MPDSRITILVIFFWNFGNSSSENFFVDHPQTLLGSFLCTYASVLRIKHVFGVGCRGGTPRFEKLLVKKSEKMWKSLNFVKSTKILWISPKSPHSAHFPQNTKNYQKRLKIRGTRAKWSHQRDLEKSENSRVETRWKVGQFIFQKSAKPLGFIIRPRENTKCSNFASFQYFFMWVF